jgi:septum site-determining protein MinD
MRIIGVVSGKGGVGKTTLVANLGLALVDLGKKVTAVDCNITTSHLGFSFGQHYYPQTLNQVLKGESNISDVASIYSGLKVIPASLEIEDLIGVNIDELESHIKNLPDTEIVLLDSAPGFGKEAMSVLKTCNEVVFVTIPYFAAVSDVIKSSKLVSQMGIKPIGIVLNMVSKRFHELSATEIETLTNLPVISEISFDQNVQRSLVRGTPVVQYDPYSPASMEIRKLASSIIGEDYRFKGNKFSKLYVRFKRMFY